MNDGSGRTLAQAREIVEALKVDPDKYRDPLDIAVNLMFGDGSVKAVQDMDPREAEALVQDSYYLFDDADGRPLQSTLGRHEEMADMFPNAYYFRYTAEGARLKKARQPVPPSEKWRADLWHSHTRKEANERALFGIKDVVRDEAGRIPAANKDPKKGGRPRKVKAD
jgi:hypothetical protein